MRIGRGPRNTSGRSVFPSEHEAKLAAKSATDLLNEISAGAWALNRSSHGDFRPGDLAQHLSGRPLTLSDVQSMLFQDEEFQRGISLRQNTFINAELLVSIEHLTRDTLDRFFREGRFPMTWTREMFHVEVASVGGGINIRLTMEDR